MRVRSALITLLVALTLATPAAADCRRLAETDRSEEGLAVAGGQVFGLAKAEGRYSFSAFAADGTERRLVRLGRYGFLAVDASPQALGALTPRGFWLGPFAGPLVRRAEIPVDVAVSGSTVLTLEGEQSHEAIVARDLAAGGAPRQVVHPPDRDPSQLHAAGPYVSVVINHEAENSALLVYEIATGRLVYRLETGPVNGYDLGPDGRIVLVGGTNGRVPIMTATPAQPQLRTIARLRVMPYIALGGAEIALAQNRSVSRMLLLNLDGTHRVVSGPIGPVSSLAYDGATLAFAAGHCLYGGTGARGPATDDGCFDQAPVSYRWRLKGRKVRVRVPRRHLNAARGPTTFVYVK